MRPVEKTEGWWVPVGLKTTTVPHYLKRTWMMGEMSQRSRPGIAIQAGACAGLWPWLLATEYQGKFERVLTFEPEPTMYQCAFRNLFVERTSSRVRLVKAALGDGTLKTCSMNHASLGSHHVTAWGAGTIDVTTVDSVMDSIRWPHERVSLLQLDVEGTEFQALNGALKTITEGRPLIQLETVEERTRVLLAGLGYEETCRVACDYIFEPSRA